MSPEAPASQPGIPRLKCHGSLDVTVGVGGISFEKSGDPACAAFVMENAVAQKQKLRSWIINRYAARRWKVVLRLIES